VTNASHNNRLVATIGLHASASTWVFNVVRELMVAAFGAQEVLSLYTEEPGELPDRLSRTNQNIVLKSHHGSAGFDAWLESVQANVLLSVRDPRDASVSMAHRFNAPLKVAAGWLVSDCRRMVTLCPHNPVLKYEERFFEHRTTVDQIAKAMNLELESNVIDAIFDRYATGAVRGFAQKLADSGAEMDEVTQIHRGHVGNTRSGKWRELPGDATRELTRLFAPYLEPLGYLQ
jgi:hypothetical protein